jgi:hypothetical protein
MTGDEAYAAPTYAATTFEQPQTATSPPGYQSPLYTPSSSPSSDFSGFAPAQPTAPPDPTWPPASTGDDPNQTNTIRP